MKKFLLLLLPAVAFAGKKESPVVQSLPTQVPLDGLYLRNAFDTDPTEYIGGFVMREGVPDESAAARLACSSYVGYKEVGGGGVTTTDVFTVSQSVALKLGIPPVVAVQAGFQRGTTVLVKYTATKKWQAVVEDPGGFATCCATYPDQCRDQYIGDFLGGTGKIYAEVASRGGGKASGMSSGVAGEVVAHAGKSWSYTNEFPIEVAFAFKLKAAPVSTGIDFKDPICDSEWRAQVPNDPRGHWERAVSDVLPDEAGAQASAWDHAAVQMAKWCGADVNATTSGARMDAGNGASTASRLGSAGEWSVVAAALVSRMRLVCSESDVAATPRGNQHKLTGLYLLPQAEVASTCETLKRTVEAQWQPEAKP